MSAVEPSSEVERIESPFARRRTALEGGASPAGAPHADANGPQCDAKRDAALTRSRSLGSRPPRTLGELRPMTGYEEQLVEDQARWGNTSALCNEVLARCLCAPGAEPGAAALGKVLELTVAERDAALIALRRATFGDNVVSEIDCPACAQVNQITFDLKQLALTIGPIPERIETTLWDDRLATLRLPTAADQTRLLEQNLQSDADRRTWLLAQCTLELAGARGPFAAEAVHAWDSRTRRELETALEAAIPDLDLRMRVACTHCEREFSAPFQIENFFLPS